jgi:hypothetical protein
MGRRRPLSERFFEKTQPEPNTGCLLWTGCALPLGYGLINVDGHGTTPHRAHRVAWELSNGPIPPGMEVLHECDTPACVNVDHLRVGTHAENMREMAVRRRAARGERHGSVKVPDRDLDAIRRRTADGESYAQVARDYGVSPTCIGLIARGERRAA